MYSKALEDVIAERRRQIDVEGWDLDHDDKHTQGQLAKASAAYSYAASLQISDNYSELALKNLLRLSQSGIFSTLRYLWPSTWHLNWFKPVQGDPRRSLVKAAALAIAQIEAIDRAKEKNKSNA